MRRVLSFLLVGGWLAAVGVACGHQPGSSGASMPTAVAAQQTMLARQTTAAGSYTPSPSPGPSETAATEATAAASTAEAATTASATRPVTTTALPSDVPPPTGTQPPLATPEPDPTDPEKAAEPSPLVARNLAGNLLSNGAFEDLADWGTLHQSNVADEIRLEDGGNFVLWERTQSHSDGGAVGVFQDLEADVAGAERLDLCADVWVGYHTLRNTGWMSDDKKAAGETPVRLAVYYLDADGNRHKWSFAFLVDDADDPTPRNQMVIPAAKWLLVCFDLMDDDLRKDSPEEKTLPQPATITQVRLFGSGWDFKGAVGNVRLQAR